jgi:hypothetical protein
MQDSDKRTVGLVATAITALLCGCPGLISLCFGAMFALTGSIPGADIDIGGSSDPAAAIWLGLGGICVGLLLVAIPAAVAFFMLRNRAASPSPPVSRPPVSDEPLPPAI